MSRKEDYITNPKREIVIYTQGMRYILLQSTKCAYRECDEKTNIYFSF
jgi:hypothetical protein